MVEDQDHIEKHKTFYINKSSNRKTKPINGMCAQRMKKEETPHPLKEEKARIRARSSLVSFYHRASDIRR